MTALNLDLPSLLRCPRTHASLVRDDGGYRTGDHRVTYPVDRGVPNFRFHQPTGDDETALRQLVDSAEEMHWRDALLKHRPDLLGYVDNAQRTIFFDLLPLTPSTVSLEIGPGLGQLLVPLSQRIGAAYAVELSPAQARFAAIRAKQEGRDNVFVTAGGDDLLLPFADDAFDLVIINQVIEWVKLPDEDGGALAGQKLILKEIHRVLKPGGTCFLATKNRFSLRYLLGGPDENARELRFGNALPRWLMRRLTAGRTQGWMGLLHSYRGLSRMLRDAGFSGLKSYWAGPDPRYPKWYVGTAAAEVRAARRQTGFAQGSYRLTRFLMPLLPAGLVKHFTPGLAFIVRKA